jgi:hypothetical protein
MSREQAGLSKLDAVRMWVQAANYLRREFDIVEDGDRLYHDYYDWYQRLESLERNTDSVKLESAGRLPLFEPVAMVYKAPLI